MQPESAKKKTYNKSSTCNIFFLFRQQIPRKLLKMSKHVTQFDGQATPVQLQPPKVQRVSNPQLDGCQMLRCESTNSLCLDKKNNINSSLCNFTMTLSPLISMALANRFHQTLDLGLNWNPFNESVPPETQCLEHASLVCSSAASLEKNWGSWQIMLRGLPPEHGSTNQHATCHLSSCFGVFLTACRVETERSYASGGLAIRATVHHQPQLNPLQAWCCRSALEAAKGPEKGQKDVKPQKD